VCVNTLPNNVMLAPSYDCDNRNSLVDKKPGAESGKALHPYRRSAATEDNAQEIVPPWDADGNRNKNNNKMKKPGLGNRALRVEPHHVLG
jgi:hypothetical protein